MLALGTSNAHFKQIPKYQVYFTRLAVYHVSERANCLIQELQARQSVVSHRQNKGKSGMGFNP